MKKTLCVAAVLCLMACIISWLGIGYNASYSAVSDLKKELVALYGVEYTDREVGAGTETMVFSVEPKTFFLTNWNVRNFLGLDYAYACKVIITSYVDGKETKVHTITYQGYDPMGKESTADRAYLDLDSRTETEKLS